MTRMLFFRFMMVRLLATTVTVVAEFTVGALNKPWLLMVPLLADHETPVSLVFVTEALSWTCPPEFTVGASGVMLTLTAGGLPDDLGPILKPAHPIIPRLSKARVRSPAM